jgi:hypothetical protein
MLPPAGTTRWFASVRLGNVFRRRWLPTEEALTGVDMTITASAGLAVFVVAIPLAAQAQSKGTGQVSLAPNAEYNAKWDACEAQARRRGTPPGTTGYADFIGDCVEGSTHRAATVEHRRRAPEKLRLDAAVRSASKARGRSTSLARVIGRGSEVE